MRYLALLLLVATICSAQTKTPVLVELFTSEGCSSCPPADQLLFRLEQQPVANADIIVLGEHVDYWDQLGWRDRFSDSRFTDRQSLYANHFGIDGPYTPEMVVNGRSEFVGNNAPRALHEIAQAAKSPGVAPQISLTRNPDRLHVTVTTQDRHPLNVMCAITERDLSTKVGGGENGGRELHHTGVVRQLTKLGSTRDGRFDSDVPLKLSRDWRPENLHAVIFLQKGVAGEITGATQIPLK
jgi:hypothetical protein